MVNDTLKVTQNFEIGLSEYRGKITGYTYQTYIIRDTFYYSVKRIKAERKDGFLVVEDVERIGDNFPENAARKVRMTSKFPLINDTTIDFMKGHWSTNQTKVYYSVGGGIELKELQDEKQSELLSHLQEANIKNDLAVSHPLEDQKAVAKNQPAIRPQQKDPNRISENHKKDIADNSPVEKSTSTTAQNSDIEKNAGRQSLIQNSEPGQVVATNNNPQSADLKNRNLVADKSIVINKPAEQNEKVEKIQNNDSAVERNSNSQKATNTVTINTPTSRIKESIAEPSKLPSIVAERKNENMQDLYFKNDSLVLSLYDNGIVDGDTVSVFVNGESIISKQMLKTVAIKKTIYIPTSTDTVQLILFAENLGTIPPNTGLLIVRDGDDSYQVHFSADLQTNASITLKRRKE
jgi:hypothetical protein